LAAEAFFFAGFFAAGFFFESGMDMPGMCICAAAGLANSTLAPSKNDSDFSGNSLKRSTVDRRAEGALEDA